MLAACSREKEGESNEHIVVLMLTFVFEGLGEDAG